jgi:hypothetical protein
MDQHDGRRPEGQPAVKRRGDRGEEFPVRPREDRPCVGIDRPGVEDPPDPDRLVGAVGGQDDRTRCRRSGADRLDEPLSVVLDEANRASHDRRRAAIVHFEIDSPEARQLVGKGQDPPNIGESPAVDRLVVVSVTHRYRGPASRRHHLCASNSRVA